MRYQAAVSPQLYDAMRVAHVSYLGLSSGQLQPSLRPHRLGCSPRHRYEYLLRGITPLSLSTATRRIGLQLDSWVLVCTYTVVP
ncbi:Protein of unknown function [Pyronema omphalodes CBS 100304]|uniref:Uncharacterized protein n=1 Tax=Pyronema omphalodes (strain CBS 100304) TaxID=1076935 RepID=U4LKL7_PYROM|nr:Protein of unknown function [Pyronema omphalodes CBS 100304]